MASYGGTAETTIYIGGLIEKVTLGSVTSWKHYISGGSGPVAIYTRKSGAADEMHYLTRDHLGSVDSVTTGVAPVTVEVRLSFGAFGQRRKEAGWSGNPTSGDWTEITDTTRRGFTFHEMLDNLSLIHMNGRVYDPVVGRFLSADPFIQAPGSTQSFNRYSYVRNNPLTLTDPSGFFEEYGKWVCKDSCISISNGFGWLNVVLGLVGGRPVWNPIIMVPPWAASTPVADPGEPPPTEPPPAEPPTIDEKVNVNVTSCPGDIMPCGSTAGGAHSGQFLRQLVIGAVDSFLRDFWESPRIDAIGDEHPSPAEIFGPYQSPFAPPVTNEDQLARDLGPAATIVLGVVTRRPVGAAKRLPDSALVCRGGTCTAERFVQGRGVSVDSAGRLQGVSVNSAPGKTVEQLTVGIPNKQVGVSTVGDVRRAGGDVILSPTRGNPDHCTLCGITPRQAEELFTPTVPNPNR